MENERQQKRSSSFGYRRSSVFYIYVEYLLRSSCCRGSTTVQYKSFCCLSHLGAGCAPALAQLGTVGAVNSWAGTEQGEFECLKSRRVLGVRKVRGGSVLSQRQKCAAKCAAKCAKSAPNQYHKLPPVPRQTWTLELTRREIASNKSPVETQRARRAHRARHGIQELRVMRGKRSTGTTSHKPQATGHRPQTIEKSTQ